jgi:hypothetical protein
LFYAQKYLQNVRQAHGDAPRSLPGTGASVAAPGDKKFGKKAQTKFVKELIKGHCHDSKTSVWRVSALFPQEERQNWEAEEFGHIQDPFGG